MSGLCWQSADNRQPASRVVVFDTYATDGFWPSTKVSYGEWGSPSYSHWVVYYRDCE